MENKDMERVLRNDKQMLELITLVGERMSRAETNVAHLFEALGKVVRGSAEHLSTHLTILERVNAMAQIQGIIVKALAAQDSRLQSYFASSLDFTHNVFQGTELDTGAFAEYIAWMRDLASGETGDQAPPRRPPWLKGVIDGGKPNSSAEDPSDGGQPA